MTDTRHSCPGECGRMVERHLFACRGCWARLPVGLRMPITRNYRRDPDAHLDAMLEALAWYRANDV